MRILLVLAFAMTTIMLHAQKKTDTVLIDASKINTGVLREGTHRYLVYFKMGVDSPRSRAQFWTRTISFGEYNGKPSVEVNQEWEDRDTIVHVVRTVCERKTFLTLYQKSWWRQSGATEYDFVSKTGIVNTIPLSDADTARQRKGAWNAFKSAQQQYFLNWHLDLEVFPVLPYKKDVTFLIPFYEPGSINPMNVAYTVTGSGELTGYDNQKVDCWIMRHESRGNVENFWISKKTREVLKLEQEFAKNRWRYKIKMGFSI